MSHRNTSGLVIALTIDSADELHHLVHQEPQGVHAMDVVINHQIRDLDALVVGAGFRWDLHAAQAAQ